MTPLVLKQSLSLKGRISLPGDKSIAHRAVILSALSEGKTLIQNFPFNRDCLATADVFKKLGIKISKHNNTGLVIYGKGLRGLKRPGSPIFINESGTTLRLLLGVLAGQDFKIRITAGKALSKRPMLRITNPLRLMGAEISSKVKVQKSKMEEYPPITIHGGNLKGISYKMPVASAQVKGALLLAGLFAKDKTEVIEPKKTRDHTERMLKLFSARVKIKSGNVTVSGNQDLVSPGNIYIPGDISSASFFIVLASILPGSRICIKNVSLNPTRLGMIRVLKRMGADIKTQSSKLKTQNLKVKTQNYEPYGDLIIKSSILKGVRVKKEEIPFLIDELPVLLVASSIARGMSVFESVGELRVKEADRIYSMTSNLKAMGVKIYSLKRKGSEDIIVQGVQRLKGARVKSFGDHRTAMSMVVAGMRAEGVTRIDDISCISKSFPDFLATLWRLKPKSG